MTEINFTDDLISLFDEKINEFDGCFIEVEYDAEEGMWFYEYNFYGDFGGSTGEGFYSAKDCVAFIMQSHIAENKPKRAMRCENVSDAGVIGNMKVIEAKKSNFKLEIKNQSKH